MIFDNITAKTLSAVAKKGTAITWACAPAFINEMIAKLSVLPRDIMKVIIIPNNVDIALNSISNFAETRHWYEELSMRIARLNTEIIVSSSIGDNVYIIQKPLLAEYQGIFPQVYQEGFDERSNEYWLQFLMSSSSLNPRIPEAITEYTISSIDIAKFSDATCPA